MDRKDSNAGECCGRERRGGSARAAVATVVLACLTLTGCAAGRRETRSAALDPVADLFRGYASAEWEMSPSEVKAAYAKYRVAEEERTVDFGRERRRIVLESEKFRREFVFEQKGSRLVVRRMSVTWIGWDEAKFETIRSGLAGKWGGPHDSRDVFGVPYDKWEFQDSATGAQIRATLLAPRKPLMSSSRTSPASAPSDSAEQAKDTQEEFGETLPPTLSILYEERSAKSRRASRGAADGDRGIEASSGAAEK